jgi:hypothetical protein
MKPFHDELYYYTANGPSGNKGYVISLPAATEALCPAGRILHATGKKLVPGIHPMSFINGKLNPYPKLLISVYDSVSLLRGFIDPSSTAFLRAGLPMTPVIQADSQPVNQAPVVLNPEPVIVNPQPIPMPVENNTNLTDVYFTDNINNWQYVLATYIDNRFYGLRFNDSMYATRGYDARLKIAAGTSNFTIETWYYETAARYNCTIVDMGNYNYTFQIRNVNVSNAVGLSFTNANFNGGGDWLYAESAVVPVAQWSHLAITRSGSTFTFYVNGVARQTFTNSTSLFSNNSTFAIGWQSPDSCQCNRMKTDCVLYDIRLWNVARTASEIQMNRNRIIPANSSGLVANYLCTDNSSTFNDRTSNALHTTIQSYDSARWTNSLVPIPNIGFLINNGYSLTSYNSTALNAVTHFDDITNTDFSNLNLSGVNFTNANLTGCNFTSAILSNAILNGANLTNANLTNATLDGTYLIGANLTGATTTGSTIASAITTTTLIKSNSSAF